MKTGSSFATDSGPDDIVLDRLAQNIEMLRHRAGLSLTAVATRAGVSVSLLKHIVHRRANPSVADVLRLANALGVTVRGLTEPAVDESSLPAPTLSVRPYDAEGFSAMFGARLRAYRMRKGVSPGQLTELAQITRNTLRSMERRVDEPGTRIVARIAHAFNVSFADLVESLHSSVLAYARARTAASAAGHELLSDSGGSDGLRMEELRLRPHQKMIRPALKAGSTTMIYGVDGSPRIAFQEETLVLQHGEAALVAADRQFTITASGGKSANLLLIVRTAEPTSVDAEI